MHDNNFDEEKGKFKEFGGKAQKGFGDLTGDEEMSAEGRKNETSGKAQGFFGKAKNAIGDSLDNAKDALDPNNKDPMTDEDSLPSDRGV